MDATLENIERTARAAAEAGGEVVRHYFEQGCEVRNKSSYDLVTDADLESERRIGATIREAFPEHAILGEELHRGQVDSPHLWVIDPLDGTNNFAHQIPHCAVSIAYFERGVARCGVVLNPIRQDLFRATAGQGAYHNEQLLQVSPATRLDQSLVGVGFYYDRGAMMQATLRAIEQCFAHEIHGIRRFGTAALDLCQVAAGWFAGFFEYKLSPWDFAAGALIVSEAGGQVSDCMGQPLPLAQTSVLASNATLHPTLLGIVEPPFRQYVDSLSGPRG